MKRSDLAPHSAHLLAVLALFGGLLFGGRVLFFRDASFSYYPDYVFLARSLEHGVWPLYNPTSDAGAPFVAPYPLAALIVKAVGPMHAPGLMAGLHVLLAMSGTTRLARRLGSGPLGAWLAGATFGLSGFVLGSLLYPVFLALALAPWVITAWLSLVEGPSAPAAARLGILAALQTSTLGGEVVLQTALACLVLRPPPARKRLLAYAALALLVALLLLAPVLLAVHSALNGTPRGAGFSREVGFSYSAPPIVLAEAVWPHLLGDVHAFSDVGFWGQPFFPEGSPFVLSLYVGCGVLLLASLAGGHRLWGLAALGILLSLGDRGPLEAVLAPLLQLFRVPVKFFFLAAFSVALLAGRGLDRAARGEVRPHALALGPGLALLTLAGLVALFPGAVADGLSAWVPQASDWRARHVIETAWAGDLARSGALVLSAGMALWRGGTLIPVAAVAVVADLLVVNAGLNPTADSSFYALRQPMAQRLREAESAGQYRWFSYGLRATIPLRFSPDVVSANSDYWLYYLERQSLLPRSHVIDGAEGAFDEDRTGLLPDGAALPPSERDPSRFRNHYARLRLGNVRWVLSYTPLPPDLVRLRAEIAQPELFEPLGLFEIRDPLPRAFWVPSAEVIGDDHARRARLDDPAFDPLRSVVLDATPPVPAQAGAAFSGEREVRVELLDPHTVRLHVSSPPGFVVVVMGHDPAWRLTGPEGSVPLIRANGRYWALRTAGGTRTYVARYRPAWLPAGIGLACAGVLLAVVAIVRPSR